MMDDSGRMKLRTSRCTGYNDVLCGHGGHGLNEEAKEMMERNEKEKETKSGRHKEGHYIER